MAGPSRDGDTEPGPLDDATVAQRWAELTADLGDLEVPDGLREDAETARGDGGSAGTDENPQTDVPQRRPDRDGALDPGAFAPSRDLFAERALGPRDYLEPEDPDGDRFVPPDPEPIGGADPVLTLGWVATAGSLLAALVLVVLASPPRWLLLALGAALLCGIGLLLWRMPAGRDEDDHDDGAVV